MKGQCRMEAGLAQMWHFHQSMCCSNKYVVYKWTNYWSLSQPSSASSQSYMVRSSKESGYSVQGLCHGHYPQVQCQTSSIFYRIASLLLSYGSEATSNNFGQKYDNIYKPWTSHLYNIDIEATDSDCWPYRGHQRPGVHSWVSQVNHEVIVPSLEYTMYMLITTIINHITMTDETMPPPESGCILVSMF